MNTKICSHCKVEKDTECFTKQTENKDSLRYWCKVCIKEKAKNNYINNKEKINIRNKKYYNKNKEKISIQKKEYNTKNKTHIAIIRKEYKRKKLQTDLIFRITSNLRRRLRSILKNNQKIGSAISDLGCSIQHLRLHLELFWDEGMSWDNYGNKEWQWNIDHIKPLSKFDLTNREQLLEAVNFRNLQPLWHLDNIKKSNKVKDE